MDKSELLKKMHAPTDREHKVIYAQLYKELHNCYTFSKLMFVLLAAGTVVCTFVCIFVDNCSEESIENAAFLAVSALAFGLIHTLAAQTQKFARAIKRRNYSVCECQLSKYTFNDYVSTNSSESTEQVKIKLCFGEEIDNWFDVNKKFDILEIEENKTPLYLVSDGTNFRVVSSHIA